MLMYAYPLEKFYSAVHALATMESDVRDRIYSAYTAFSPLRESDIPEDIRDDYRFIMSKLTTHKAEEPGEGSVKASLRHMDDDTAGKVAGRIVEVLVELQRYRDVPR